MKKKFYLKQVKEINKMKYIFKFLYLINSLLLFTLLLSYLSPMTDPVKFWPIAFTGLIYPFLFFINIIFLIFWFFSWKKYVWANIIILLIGSSFIEKFIGINELKNITTNNTAKVLSYNVRLFNKNENIKEKGIKEKIIDLINKENTDILCIQEFEEFEKNLYFDSLNYHPLIKNSRLQIFSKYAEIKSEIVKDNICIYKDLKIGDDTLRVYNIHLHSNWANKIKLSFQNRSKEVKIIKNNIQTSKYKTLICGDLNDTPMSYTYKTISSKFNDAFVFSGKGIGDTHSSIPLLRIDYIFTSKGISTSKYIKHNEKYSDHHPISCEISLE